MKLNMEKKNILCFKSRNKEEYFENKYCQCRNEKQRNIIKSVLELEKKLESKRQENLKQIFDFKRQLEIGRYIANFIKDEPRCIYMLSPEEEEALEIFNKFGEQEL